ncbi:MAG: lipoate--protein ligase family protein [Simkaniaceae bacterium]|nr:lipoate--protein ligase family protein [Simkaniaceae bacterium]
METDGLLLEKLTSDPLIHFYDWETPSATYGYFTDVALYLKMPSPLSLARRPTGGGIIFHTLDYAFSVLVPATHPRFSENILENYRLINEPVQRAIGATGLLKEEPVPFDEASRHFCMAKPTKYDVMIGSRKVAGAAQRKKKQGFLHQGSIALLMPTEEFLDEVLLPGTRVKEGMFAHTHCLVKEKNQLDEVRKALKENLRRELWRELQ